MARVEGLQCREDVRDFGIMFDPVMEHFKPGNPDSLITPQARLSIKAAKRQLADRGLSRDEIIDLVHDTTHEARHLTAWLAVVSPEDFHEKTIR